MRTGQQYLESLRDGRHVYVGGELIHDVTTHPKTSGYAKAIAEYYDLHLEPEHQDVLTFVDDDGVRKSMHWFLPRSKADAARRRAYHEFWFRHFQGGIFTRPPAGMNVVMYAQVDDPEPWEDNAIVADGRKIPFAHNIRAQWARVTTDDVALSPMFVDVQFDRGRDNGLVETPCSASSNRTTTALSCVAGKPWGPRFPSSTSC